MIPRDFIYKCMFFYLYKVYTGKLLFYIFIIYITLIFYYQVNDSSILGLYTSFFLILCTQPFFINEKLKKEFTRYKRYLVLKRKRANRFNIKKEKLNEK
jgi:hypothetical protein